MAGGTLFEGSALSVKRLKGDIAELNLDSTTGSVNKFDRATIEELRQGVDAIKGDKTLKGLLITSGKPAFVVGADITEFLTSFKAPDEDILAWLRKTHDIMNDIEDLTIPSAVAINGIALGGGFEICLPVTYRIASTEAKVGLPETKLGIYPGWGGCVRLPRLIGADNAIEWIAGGKQYAPKDALDVGAVDAVVAPEKLMEASLHMLQQAIDGKFDWQKKRQEKIEPLKLRTPIEGMMVFEGGKGFVKAMAGPHYPAPIAAIKAMQAGAALGREAAIEAEIKGFVKMARTSVAESLIGIFLADQANKKKIKGIVKKSLDKKVEKAAVLGAGIMGGGIAYQSASKGVPIVMKDIKDDALELGMGEATKLLSKQVERKKISTSDMGRVLASISPTLNNVEISSADIVVEAVIENEKIKKSVLAEMEDVVKEGTILASNTSTISISNLATALKRPEDFCGMHFFNPVHRMPLVEVIRGEKSSEAAIARTVAYAQKMGKTPIVVNDCPGFLVNRVLFPYLAGFTSLLEDGVDFTRIDKVMEKYGWPMGPAYLTDVVGIDTSVHAATVMGEGFPDRMAFSDKNAMTVLKDAGRFGQKSGSGFYQYEIDRKGKPKKKKDESVYGLLEAIVKEKKEVSDEQIVERMMIPMTNEAARCLEEKIVDSPIDVDLGLVYGLGFPPFRGGAIRELDRLGADKFVASCEKYKALGGLYEPAPLIVEKSKDNSKFYQF